MRSQQQQEPLMSASKGDQDLSHDELAHLHPKSQVLRQHLRNAAVAALSFCAGAALTAILVLTTGPAPSAMLQNLNDARIAEVTSGTDVQTGQPASWFNGNCGRSAEEARSQGCVFDLISHSWLPEDCLYSEDFEDADIMYANSTWHWGLDDTTEVSLGDVRRGEFDRVWTSMDWHVTHCGFVWKRLHRALLDPARKLDSYTADYHHTNHCVGMIADLSPVEPVNSTGTRVYTKFPRC